MTTATARRHKLLEQDLGSELGRELVIIDSRIDQWEMLAAGVRPDCEVVVLHPLEDGIEQITNFLSLSNPPTHPQPLPGGELDATPLLGGVRGGSTTNSPCPSKEDIATLHIISHGEPGTLYLGNSILNAETLQSRYWAAVQEWRHALADNAHILIYGCNVAAPETGRSIPSAKLSVGTKDCPGDAIAPTVPLSHSIPLSPCPPVPRSPSLLSLLHQLTGAHISASIAPTGSASLGGNWQLEVSTAKVQPALALQPEVMANYGSTLSLQLEWAKAIGSVNFDEGKGIATDSSGNVLVTGYFSGNIDINGDGADDLTNSGIYDAYVAKFDSSGILVWAKSFGDSSNDRGYGIATDGSGNVFATGNFSGNIDIDGDGNIDLTSNNLADAYMAKLDSSGTLIWAKSFGSSFHDTGNGIASDSSGNVLVTGDFSDNIDIDGDGNIDLTKNGGDPTSYDAYVARFDSSGTLTWAKAIGNSSNDQGKGIATDGSGNVLATGFFSGNIDIDGDGNIDLTSSGSTDAYVAKLDSSGTLSWAKAIGSSSNDQGNGIATDSSGNVFATGSFWGSIDIDGDGNIDLTDNSAIHTTYVAKFDSSGALSWAKDFGSSISTGNGIAIDGSGNILVAGSFLGSIDVDGDGTNELITHSGLDDTYAVKFDSSGNLIEAKVIGSSISTGNGIAADSNGNILVAGSFSDNIDIDGDGTNDLTSNGSSDAYVVKLSTNIPPTSADTSITLDEDTTYNFAESDFPFTDANGDTLQAVAITQLPTVGTFTFNGAAVSLNQVIPVADLPNLTFAPVANANGSNYDSFKFKVNDGQADSASEHTLTLDVNPVNDAPNLSTVSKSGNEDTDITFTESDFVTAFSDLENDSLTKIKITSLPSNGTLKLSGTDVSVNQEIDAAAIDSLAFTPDADFKGTTSFTWNAFDGSDYAASNAQVVLAVGVNNDAPILSNIDLSGDEDSNILFAAGDFTAAFSDVDGDDLSKIKITSLPSNGILKLDGTTVTVNQEIDTANLGDLTFTPDANFNGSTSFTWNGFDGIVYADADATVNLSIAAINDPPTLSIISKSGSEDTDIAFIATDFTAAFSDIDSDDLSKVKITSLPSNGILKLDDTAVTVNQEINTASLGKLSFTPDADFNGNVSFAWNGYDGTTYANADATANLSIAPVNDPPIVSNFTVAGNKNIDTKFTEIDFTSAFSDVDGDDLSKIKITSLPSNGTLKLYGSEVAVNQEIDTAQLNNLAFTPVPTFSGSTSFAWNGYDGATYAGANANVNLEIGAENNPPVLDYSKFIWESSFVKVGDSWQFQLTFPEEPFTDPDPGDTLSYSATLSNGNPLPDWLKFDPSTRIFSGTYSQAQWFEIKITATDPFGASASETRPFLFYEYGVIIDGYIEGGTVFFDANLNGVQDTNEPVTTSDANGFYDLDIPLDVFDTNNNGLIDNEEGNIVVIGGTDTATGLPLETPLTAPADGLVVTLLTSLVADLTNQGLSSEAANQQVVAALGLPDSVNVTTLDPIAATNNNEPGGLETLAAMTKVQNAVTQIANLISGAAPNLDNNLVVRDVIKTFANQIQTNANLDVSDSAQLAELIDKAATAVQQSDSNLDLQRISTLAADAAEVMAAANQQIDNIVSSSGANPGQQIHFEIAQVQFVALGETSQDLQLAGADEKSIADVVAENTGANLQNQIQAAAAQLPNPPAISPPPTLPAPSFANVNLELVLGSQATETGSENNDTLTGDSGQDIFLGQQGNDLLEGRDGDDWMNGNRGEDTLSGGLGNDTLYGGKENDILNGDDGNDVAFGNWGSDSLSGGNGDDFLSGNQENDTLNGGDGNDTLHGGKNEDLLFGNNGSDILYGDLGNDSLNGEDGDDFLNGNQGEDTLTGGNGNDTLRGGQDNDILNGGDGSDWLAGDKGNDLLTGGNGSDIFVLKAGYGSDNIADFTNGTDLLELAGGLTFEQLTITGNNGNTLIANGSELLATLTGVDVSLIASEDFT